VISSDVDVPPKRSLPSVQVTDESPKNTTPTGPNDPSIRPIIVLLGATASGKTALSIELAHVLPHGGECVLADSMQVYRGMTIGTTQPTQSEQRMARHHLCGFVDPRSTEFTVRNWLDAAEDAIQGIRLRGRHPIVVGGTNLYIRALLEGVFEGPGRNDILREELEQVDAADLHDRLTAVDPESAMRIHRNDHRRLVRAIEVHAATGVPLSTQQTEWSDTVRGRPDTRLLILNWPVEALNRRINARTKAMLTSGLIEEVQQLQSEGGLGMQAQEAVGYREILNHLEGRCSRAEAEEQIKIRTRRYGKQQRTWLRRFSAVPGAIRLEAEGRDATDLAQEAIQRLQNPA
jgi:tRNA dimethylallyltransferase